MPATKAEWIKQGLDNFRTRYPRIKAAVYWHERWQNLDQSYSNLHINSSVESLNAYREGHRESGLVRQFDSARDKE